MEALIVTSLVGLGWLFSESKERTDAQKTEQRNRPVVEPRLVPRGFDINQYSRPSSHLNAFNNEAIKRHTAQNYPEKSGLVSPHYSSFRVQNTNDEVKQRRLETFTGSDSIWKKKKEVEHLFKPTPQPIDHSGTQGNLPTYNDREALNDSLTAKQHSALPFEQVRVGPGVAVDLDVPAADGLHSQYRAMPTLVMPYHDSTLVGDVNHGAAEGQQQLVDPHVPRNHPPKVFDQARRPMEKGRATVTAPMVRSRHTKIHPMYGTDPGNLDKSGGCGVYKCHVVGEEYFGNQIRAQTYEADSEHTRKGDRTYLQDWTNLGTNEASRIGAPQQVCQNVLAPTNRGITDSRTTGLLGPRYRVDKDRHNCTGLQLLKQSKRSHYAEADRMAGPQNCDSMRRAHLGASDDPYLSRMYMIRDKANASDHQPLGRLEMGPSDVGDSRDPKKGRRYDYKNITMDHTIAAENLANNPYAVQNLGKLRVSNYVS